MIAGALAVELMTSTLHAGQDATVEKTLGIPAHSMRGWLSSGQQISPAFQKFDKCSACSDRVRKRAVHLVKTKPTFRLCSSVLIHSRFYVIRIHIRML